MVDIMQPCPNHFEQLGFVHCSAMWFGQATPNDGRELPLSGTVCRATEEQPSPHASDCCTDVLPCFASELEREVAELEEKAHREPSWFGGAYGLAEDAYPSDKSWPSDEKAEGDELLSMDGQENSNDSSGGNVAISPVSVHADVLEDAGSTLPSAVWKGCCKSAWCDRADRHPGLCNAKATNTGPMLRVRKASCDLLMNDQQGSDEDEQLLGGEDSCDGMEASGELGQAASGALSRTQKNGRAEEWEVDSALKQGCRSSLSDDADLLSASAEELSGGTLVFRGAMHMADARSLPLWPDAASQRDPFAEHAMQSLFAMEEDEPGLLQVDSCKPLLGSGAVASQGPVLATSASSAALHDACLPGSGMLGSHGSSSQAAPRRLRLALNHAASPASVMVPMALASPAPQLAPATALPSQALERQASTALPPPAATPPAMPPAAAAAVAPAAPVPKAAVSAAPSKVAAVKRTSVAAPTLVLPKRVSKSSKAAKAAAEAPSSPRGKKRTAGRMAANPNGHCCTQCGTQSTPVWRAGPHGPKTLCNACGVRYMKVAKRK